jgi:MFS family permease
LPRVASILAVTTVIQSLVALASIAVPVMTPAAARDLGFSPSLIGWFVGAMYIGASFAALVGGGLILRYGAIRVCQVCLCLCALALALLAVAPPILLLPLAILLGAGYGPITPASSHILSRTMPQHMMGLTFSIKQTGVPLGAVLAGLLVPALTLGFGWRGAALGVASLCAAAALVVQIWRTHMDDDRDPARRFALAHLRAPFRLIAADAGLKRTVATALAFAGLQISGITFLVAYLTESVGMSLVAAGLALAFCNAGGIVGRVLWGFVADRTRAPRTVLGLLGLAMAGASVATAAFTAGWPYALLLAVCAIYGVTAIGWNGVLIAETVRLSPPGTAALVSGGSTFLMFFGVVFYPPVFTLLHDLSDSYRLPLVVFALPALAMGWLQLRARPA